MCPDNAEYPDNAASCFILRDALDAPRPHLKNLLQLFVVLHHDDVGLAVFCDILTRFWRVGGVDAHCEPTEQEGQEKGDYAQREPTAVQVCHLQVVLSS